MAKRGSRKKPVAKEQEEINEQTPVEVQRVAPEDQASPEAPPPSTENVPRGTENAPTAILRAIVLGQLDPATTITGAAISFAPRAGKWRDAIALRVAWISDQGNVAIDLEWGDHSAVTSVPYGDGAHCWKFRGV